MAEGRFAAGHLGELTQQIPFEMVDEVLVETGAVQSRVRLLPARVVVYLLLAGCLFAEVGYAGVWQRLTGGLAPLGLPVPSTAALRQARPRLGVAPLRALFDLLRGPAAGIAVPGSRWHGLLVCAIDGTTTVPDSRANLGRFRKHRCNHGGSGYPQRRPGGVDVHDVPRIPGARARRASTDARSSSTNRICATTCSSSGTVCPRAVTSCRR